MAETARTGLRKRELRLPNRRIEKNDVRIGIRESAVARAKMAVLRASRRRGAEAGAAIGGSGGPGPAPVLSMDTSAL